MFHMKPCTCDHPRYAHGFTVGKIGCFAEGCPCQGIPVTVSVDYEVSHEATQ